MDRGTRHTDRCGSGRVYARDFFHDQRMGNRVETGPAPFLWRRHSAAAHLTEFADGFCGEFFLLFPFFDEWAHFRLHELADGVANQLLLVAKGKVHQSVGRHAAATSIVRGVRMMLTHWIKATQLLRIREVGFCRERVFFM